MKGGNAKMSYRVKEINKDEVDKELLEYQFLKHLGDISHAHKILVEIESITNFTTGKKIVSEFIGKKGLLIQTSPFEYPTDHTERIKKFCGELRLPFDCSTSDDKSSVCFETVKFDNVDLSSQDSHRIYIEYLKRNDIDELYEL
jgi:AMMECR1 domain-containing protein